MPLPASYTHLQVDELWRPRWRSEHPILPPQLRVLLRDVFIALDTDSDGVVLTSDSKGVFSGAKSCDAAAPAPASGAMGLGVVLPWTAGVPLQLDLTAFTRLYMRQNEAEMDTGYSCMFARDSSVSPWSSGCADGGNDITSLGHLDRDYLSSFREKLGERDGTCGASSIAEVQRLQEYVKDVRVLLSDAEVLLLTDAFVRIDTADRGVIDAADVAAVLEEMMRAEEDWGDALPAPADTTRAACEMVATAAGDCEARVLTLVQFIRSFQTDSGAFPPQLVYFCGRSSRGPWRAAQRVAAALRNARASQSPAVPAGEEGAVQWEDAAYVGVGSIAASPAWISVFELAFLVDLLTKYADGVGDGGRGGGKRERAPLMLWSDLEKSLQADLRRLFPCGELCAVRAAVMQHLHRLALAHAVVADGARAAWDAERRVSKPPSESDCPLIHLGRLAGALCDHPELFGMHLLPSKVHLGACVELVATLPRGAAQRLVEVLVEMGFHRPFAPHGDWQSGPDAILSRLVHLQRVLPLCVGSFSEEKVHVEATEGDDAAGRGEDDEAETGRSEKAALAGLARMVTAAATLSSTDGCLSLCSLVSQLAMSVYAVPPPCSLLARPGVMHDCTGEGIESGWWTPCVCRDAVNPPPPVPPRTLPAYLRALPRRLSAEEAVGLVARVQTLSAPYLAEALGVPCAGATNGGLERAVHLGRGGVALALSAEVRGFLTKWLQEGSGSFCCARPSIAVYTCAMLVDQISRALANSARAATLPSHATVTEVIAGVLRDAAAWLSPAPQPLPLSRACQASAWESRAAMPLPLPPPVSCVRADHGDLWAQHAVRTSFCVLGYEGCRRVGEALSLICPAAAGSGDGASYGGFALALDEREVCLALTCAVSATRDDWAEAEVHHAVWDIVGCCPVVRYSLCCPEAASSAKVLIECEPLARAFLEAFPLMPLAQAPREVKYHFPIKGVEFSHYALNVIMEDKVDVKKDDAGCSLRCCTGSKNCREQLDGSYVAFAILRGLLSSNTLTHVLCALGWEKELSGNVHVVMPSLSAISFCEIGACVSVRKLQRPLRSVRRVGVPGNSSVSALLKGKALALAFPAQVQHAIAQLFSRVCAFAGVGDGAGAGHERLVSRTDFELFIDAAKKNAGLPARVCGDPLCADLLDAIFPHPDKSLSLLDVLKAVLQARDDRLTIECDALVRAYERDQPRRGRGDDDYGAFLDALFNSFSPIRASMLCDYV